MENPNGGLEILWSTIEPMDLVEKAYPKLVETFLESKQKKKKGGTKNKRDASDKTPRKPKKNKPSTKNAVCKPKQSKTEKLTKISSGQTLDKFIQKTKSIHDSPKLTLLNTIHKRLESPKIKTSSIPIDLSQLSFDNMNDFDENDSVADITNIINGIILRSPELKEFCGRQLRYDRVDLNDSFHEFNSELGNASENVGDVYKPTSKMKDNSSTPILSRKSIFSYKPSPLVEVNKSHGSGKQDILNDNNVSHFFGAGAIDDVDLFEKSVDYRNMIDEFDCDSSSEDNEDCDLQQEVESNENVIPTKVDLTNNDDTFGMGNYVPIGSKLRKKLNSK